MTYHYAILAILVIGLLCLGIIRHVTRTQAATERRSRREAIKARQRERLVKREREDRRVMVQRQKLRVPTPWGWAGQSRKRDPVKKESAEQRRDRSIRALLEDRFAPVQGAAKRPLEYQKVKPPRLRDPSAPHDQMDNFGTGAADRVQKELRPHSSLRGKDESSNMKRSGGLRARDLRGLKNPWGW